MIDNEMSIQTIKLNACTGLGVSPSLIQRTAASGGEAIAVKSI